MFDCKDLSDMLVASPKTFTLILLNAISVKPRAARITQSSTSWLCKLSRCWL